MELAVSAFAAFTNQIWILRKHVSMTYLRVLDSYSFAASSEFSIHYLKTCCWSSCQIGKRAPSDGYCHVSWLSQYHKPWFLFTAMQHFKEVIAKDAFCLYFRPNTCELFASICRLRAGFPVLPSSEWKALNQPSTGSWQSGSCLPLLLAPLASLELLEGPLG